MAVAQTAGGGRAVPLAVIQLKRVPKTAMQRRHTGGVVALEHPDFMASDAELTAVSQEIRKSTFTGKGKYRKQRDSHVIDLELPDIGGDFEGSWLNTLGEEEAEAAPAVAQNDERAAALRALVSQGLGWELAPPSEPAPQEFRTRTPMPDESVPQTLMAPDDVKPLPLNAFHGLVYSQVFGPTSIRDIKDILGTFGEEKVLETLDELCVLGVVEVPLKN